MRSKTQARIPKSVVLREISQQTLTGIYKLVPKHLDIKNKKSISVKQLQYKQSIADKVAKQKITFNKPLKDVELIMRKFDEVSQQKKLAGQTPRDKIANKKSQSELEKRIRGILTLPTIRNIKQKVNQQKFGKLTEPQTATLAILAEASRQSLLRKYDEYIKMAIKPVHKKTKTEQN